MLEEIINYKEVARVMYGSVTRPVIQDSKGRVCAGEKLTLDTADSISDDCWISTSLMDLVRLIQSKVGLEVTIIETGTNIKIRNYANKQSDPVFERTFVKSNTKQSSRYVLWYHPTGKLSIDSTNSSREAVPFDEDWKQMEKEAVMDCCFLGWRDASELERRYIDARVDRLISDISCKWKSPPEREQL